MPNTHVPLCSFFGPTIIDVVNYFGLVFNFICQVGLDIIQYSQAIISPSFATFILPFHLFVFLSLLHVSCLYTMNIIWVCLELNEKKRKGKLNRNSLPLLVWRERGEENSKYLRFSLCSEIFLPFSLKVLNTGKTVDI